jgi:hypothetical protein
LIPVFSHQISYNVKYGDNVAIVVYNIQLSYNSPDLRGTQGVTTDNHDNVYIVGCLSNNIHRLRPHGTFIDIYCDY